MCRWICSDAMPRFRDATQPPSAHHFGLRSLFRLRCRHFSSPCTRVQSSHSKTPTFSVSSGPGRTGDCLVSAIAESLFAHSKRKVLTEIPDNVEVLFRRSSRCFDNEYNPARPHSTLENLSPMHFEQELGRTQAVHCAESDRQTHAQAFQKHAAEIGFQQISPRVSRARSRRPASLQSTRTHAICRLESQAHARRCAASYKYLRNRLAIVSTPAPSTIEVATSQAPSGTGTGKQRNTAHDQPAPATSTRFPKW